MQLKMNMASYSKESIQINILDMTFVKIRKSISSNKMAQNKAKEQRTVKHKLGVVAKQKQ